MINRDDRHVELAALKRTELLQIAKRLGLKKGILTSTRALIAGILEMESKAETAAVRVKRAELPQQPLVEKTVEAPGAPEEVEHTPSTPGPAASLEKPSLPRGTELLSEYGKDGITLMVRDPYWAYAHWEITPETVNRARSQLGSEAHDSVLILRVYCLSGREPERRLDIELGGNPADWYINLGTPGGSFCLDIGILTPTGKFLALARSNSVTMPLSGMSPVRDGLWAAPPGESERMYVLSGGSAPGPSSLEMKGMVGERDAGKTDPHCKQIDALTQSAKRRNPPSTGSSARAASSGSAEPPKPSGG